MVLGLGLLAVFFASWMPARAPDVEDDRACPGSNAELNKVLDRFALPLPPNATDVRFSSDVHPLFGEYTVELRFSAPPAEVSSFVAEAARGREPAPDLASGQPSSPFPNACLGLESFTPDTVVNDHGPMTSSRSIAVDNRDPDHPMVYVIAMDSI